MKLGYGFGAFGNRFTAAPELHVGLSDAGRDYRLGWRLALARNGPASLDLGLEATRTEPANDPGSAPEHGLAFKMTARF